MSEAETLVAARNHARTADDAPIDAPVQACESGTGVIEVEVVDEHDEPVRALLVELRRGPSQAMGSLTASDGQARFEGLPEGRYTVTLPELDHDAWELVKTSAVPEERSESTARCTWGGPTPPREGLTHTVTQGECLAKLADRHGVAMATAWEHPDNASLREQRESPYVLAPDDVVVLPSHRHREVDAAPGDRLCVRRLQAQETLELRFVDTAGAPLNDYEYLAELELADGTPLPAMTGKTNGKGVVRLMVPPSTVRATLRLDDGDGQQSEHVVEVGHLDPEGPSWLSKRLANLGFPHETEDEQQSSLLYLQRRHDLECTGVLDDPTRRVLTQLHDF